MNIGCRVIQKWLLPNSFYLSNTKVTWDKDDDKEDCWKVKIEAKRQEEMLEQIVTLGGQKDQNLHYVRHNVNLDYFF